jgi:hypothetical protein
VDEWGPRGAGGAYLAGTLVLGLGDEAAVSVQGGMAGDGGREGAGEENFCWTHEEDSDPSGRRGDGPELIR